MGKEPKSRDPFYIDESVGISFISNTTDATDEYDVYLGVGKPFDRQDRLYIHNGVLQELVRPGTTPAEAVRLLDSSTDNKASRLLNFNGIPHSDFYETLLQVRIKELEQEVEEWMDKALTLR